MQSAHQRVFSWYVKLICQIPNSDIGYSFTIEVRDLYFFGFAISVNMKKKPNKAKKKKIIVVLV